MANTIYNSFLDALNDSIDWSTAVIRVALERSTSTYSVDPDHDFVSDLSGFVEITVASYARVTVAGTKTKDDTNNWIKYDLADAAFGSLESGQTVKAIVLYVQTGGNDASPSNDPLIAYIDTADLLPAALAGDDFTVTWNSNGLFTLAQG